MSTVLFPPQFWQCCTQSWVACAFTPYIARLSLPFVPRRANRCEAVCGRVRTVRLNVVTCGALKRQHISPSRAFSLNGGFWPLTSLANRSRGGLSHELSNTQTITKSLFFSVINCPRENQCCQNRSISLDVAVLATFLIGFYENTPFRLSYFVLIIFNSLFCLVPDFKCNN